MTSQTIERRPQQMDSAYAWLRLGVALAIGTIASVGMWSFVVALPAVQADFGVTRAAAALPYTLAMAGFGLGNAMLGRLADRFGILAPILLGIMAIGIGYIAAGLAPSLWMLAAAHFVIGFGASASFGPMMADTSHWFVRWRGIAVGIAASGNYLSGVVWPPIVQHFITSVGWRPTHIGIGLACVVAMLPLSLMFRRRATAYHTDSAATAAGMRADLGLSPNALQALLCIAGLSCCVAMSMPQVHIVAYCSDLGYGVARGAEMLSLMLGFGIISRVGSGFIADRLGAVMTLLLGSVMQAVALGLYMLSDGLTPLYVVSALFGLFQGGIVPMYAIIVREYFPPREAGTRVGLVILSTVGGMALGGWISGLIFDLTGSYQAAFAHGILWNLLNISIVFWLLLRGRPRLVPA